MPTYYSWTLLGYPEDPLEDAVTDADASAPFASLLEDLRTLVHDRNCQAIEDLLQQHSELPLPTSRYQRFRFWYFLGRAHIVCRKWHEALDDFTYCQSIGLPLTDVMQIQLLRSWGYAAQEAHLYELALFKYDRLAELVETLVEHGEEDFIQEDAHCFLCNVYRNQADSQLWVCAPETARRILEHEAMPLLDRYEDPFDTPARDQNERNWRELHLFVLWGLGMVIAWQARLSDEPQLFAQDLFDGYESILVAAKLSQVFSEGKAWTAALYSLAAQLCLMRCELANNRGMQSMLCDLAEEHLQRAQQFRHDDLQSAEGSLRARTLDFPYHELAVRRHIIFDTVDRMDDILNAIIALQQETEQVDDASYRLFSARCLLLLASVEIELQKFASPLDVTHAQRADAYLQQGLDLLDRRPESGLNGLYEREILLKRDILKRWLL